MTMMAAEGPIAHSRMGKRASSARSHILLLLGTGEAAKLYKAQYGMSNYTCIVPHAARP